MLSGKNHCQGYFEVVNDPTSTSIEREYELISQFNLTQKDHSKQPKENTSEVLKGFFIVGKKNVKSREPGPKAKLKERTQIQSKVWLYFTWKYQVHFKLASLNSAKSKPAAIWVEQN